MSLAHVLAHKKRVLAEKAAAKQQQQEQQQEQTPSVKKDDPAKFAKIKNELPEDLNILKALNGNEERNGYKVDLIEKYREYAEAQQTKNNWGGDNLLSNWYMWNLDVLGIEKAFEMLISAIEHGISGPSQIKRDMPTLMLDAVHDFTAQALSSQKEFNTHFIHQSIEDLKMGHYVTNSALKSKLLALHGKVCLSQMDYKTAVKSFETATELNPKAGVKTLLKEAKKKLAEMQSSEQDND